jgi:hypothetical protein
LADDVEWGQAQVFEQLADVQLRSELRSANKHDQDVMWQHMLMGGSRRSSTSLRMFN